MQIFFLTSSTDNSKSSENLSVELARMNACVEECLSQQLKLLRIMRSTLIQSPLLTRISHPGRAIGPSKAYKDKANTTDFA